LSAEATFEWIDTGEALDRAAERLERASELAVDTEADSFYHYFHKCCLIQISDGEVVYLVDPLSLPRLDRLGDVLSSRAITKVLHAAEQDVLYLRRDYGFHLAPVFDTMIAAQLLGLPQIGLASLLQTHFGVRLDKGPQRDDWSRRPLSDRQKFYAGEDVRHLIRLREALESLLIEKGRLEWAREEFGRVAERAWETREFDRETFWSLKRARDLTAREAAVLRELYAMRDGKARQADLPPFRIVSDETLLGLARRSPRSPADFEGIKGFTPLVQRRIGAQVVEAVGRGLAVPEADLPIPPRGQGRRKSGAAQARLERLREWRRTRAAELGLDPGVLFPQSTLEGLALAGLPGLEATDSIPGLREWRRRLILPEAARLLV
jgi:ribonuclease D